MPDTDLPLPPSLAVTPNIPLREQTLEQLEAERDWWRAKLDGFSQWGAGVSATAGFLRACENEIAHRKSAENAA